MSHARTRWTGAGPLAALVVSLLLLTGPSGAAASPVGIRDAVQVPAAALTAREQTERYVTAVYEDLFGRDPDPVGLQSWTDALLTGTPRIAVANGITYSREFRAGLITGAYDWYLGREPDAQGLENWLAAMRGGLTISQIEAGFIASTEYFARSGGTYEAWVEALYLDVLEREPADAEIKAWVDQLRAGADRRSVAMGFLLSWEHLSTVVNGYYIELLGRELDPEGQQSWVSILQAGGRDEAIIGGIIASNEYWSNTGIVVHHLVITPSFSSVAPGQQQSYTVHAVAASGELLGDVTAQSTFALGGLASLCEGSSCSTSGLGNHSVTATFGGLSVEARLSVMTRGPLHHLTVVPQEPTVVAGGTITYAVRGSDVNGLDLGDVTGGAWIRADEGPLSCAAFTCTHLTVGRHTVSAYAPQDAPSATGSTQVVVTYPTAPAAHRLYTWGLNDHGQLARPTVEGQIHRTSEPAQDDASWVSVATGAQHTAGVRSDGTLWAWGVNAQSQAGYVFPSDDVANPTMVGSDKDWASVVAGSNFTLALKTNGTLWGWGDNWLSQLGSWNGRSTQEAPTQVTLGGTWTAVSAGEDHVLALRPDGTLWVWGGGFSGQLGDGWMFGTSGRRLGTDTWVSVAAGSGYSLAVRSDGTLWAWGRNQNGQHGDGRTVTDTDLSRPMRPLPVQVGTETAWRAVFAGGATSAGIKSDGSLWTWGGNWNGQVGDGTLDQRLEPVQIGIGSTWRSVEFGATHTVATTTADALWTWGGNANGQLGDGTTTSRVVPGQVAPGTSFPVVGAGGQHTVALVP